MSFNRSTPSKKVFKAGTMDLLFKTYNTVQFLDRKRDAVEKGEKLARFYRSMQIQVP